MESVLSLAVWKSFQSYWKALNRLGKASGLIKPRLGSIGSNVDRQIHRGLLLNAKFIPQRKFRGYRHLD